MQKVSKHAREAAASAVVLPELRSLILSGTFDHHPMAEAFAEFEAATIERCAAFLEQQDGFGEWDDAATAIRALKEPKE